MQTITTSGSVVDHPATPLLTHQLRPVSDVLDDLLRSIETPKPTATPTTPARPDQGGGSR